MSTATLRLGFVGCGAIAEWHLHAIRNGDTRIQVTAAIDPDPVRAQAIADQTGARVFGSARFLKIELGITDVAKPAAHVLVQAALDKPAQARWQVVRQRRPVRFFRVPH